MTIEEIIKEKEEAIKGTKEMKEKGFNNFTKDQLADSLAIVHSSNAECKSESKKLTDLQKHLTSLEKELNAEISNQTVVGEQLSLELGSTTYTLTAVELDEIDINCNEAVLYTACLKAGLTLYLKNNVNLTAIKKDYKNGSLHPDLLKYIVVTKQQAMKLSKKAKKEEE